MCGEHQSWHLLPDWTRGSSPRVRGTHARGHGIIGRRGIIPACAGNTRSFLINSVCYRDHPRVCGEHDLRGLFAGLVQGSSPRVRGTHAARRVPVQTGGIIPACAGNTCRPLTIVLRCWDHPRVCGEHKFKDDAARDAWGSSPRVRGTLRHCIGAYGFPGIIPACAGNTRTSPRCGMRSGDHPRVCGEHWDETERNWMRSGSSPRVRGTLVAIGPP